MFGLNRRIADARRAANIAALDFLVDRVKDTLNRDRPPGLKRNPAGNPPFLGSTSSRGTLRGSVQRSVTFGGNPVIIYPAQHKGFAYGTYHELPGLSYHTGRGRHPFVAPTAAHFVNEMRDIRRRRFVYEMLRWH